MPLRHTPRNTSRLATRPTDIGSMSVLAYTHTLPMAIFMQYAENTNSKNMTPRTRVVRAGTPGQVASGTKLHALSTRIRVFNHGGPDSGDQLSLIPRGFSLFSCLWTVAGVIEDF